MSALPEGARFAARPDRNTGGRRLPLSSEHRSPQRGLGVGRADEARITARPTFVDIAEPTQRAVRRPARLRWDRGAGTLARSFPVADRHARLACFRPAV